MVTSVITLLLYAYMTIHLYSLFVSSNGVILPDTHSNGGMKGCHGIGASEMQHAISAPPLHGKCRRPSPPSSRQRFLNSHANWLHATASRGYNCHIWLWHVWCTQQCKFLSKRLRESHLLAPSGRQATSTRKIFRSVYNRMLLLMVLRISLVLKQFPPHSLFTCNPPLSTCTEFVIIATFLPLSLSITSPSSLSPTYSLRFLRSCNSHKAPGIRFFKSRVGYCPIAAQRGCGMSQQH